jgi:hypothetical protein
MTNDNDHRRPKPVEAKQRAQTRFLLAIITALGRILALTLIERYA